MKTASILVMILLFNSLMVWGQQEGNIHVRIQKIENKQGILRVGLFKETDKFLEEASWSKDIPVNGREMVEVDFENIPYGTYAISIYQDLDENGKLDANFIGIPKEPVGFSNDHRPKMGPPKFNGAKFDLAQQKLSLTVDMYTY